MLMVLAPNHQQYKHYSRQMEEETRYISGWKNFAGISRDVPFIVVGSWSSTVDDLREMLLSMGYKEQPPSAPVASN